MSIWLWIALGAYFIGVSVFVFWYFGTKAPNTQRELWTILLTWMITLVIFPFVVVMWLIGLIRRRK